MVVLSNALSLAETRNMRITHCSECATVSRRASNNASRNYTKCCFTRSMKCSEKSTGRELSPKVKEIEPSGF